MTIEIRKLVIWSKINSRTHRINKKCITNRIGFLVEGFVSGFYLKSLNLENYSIANIHARENFDLVEHFLPKTLIYNNYFSAKNYNKKL